MPPIKRNVIFLLFVLLAGCATDFNYTPHIMYADKDNVPLSETAVLAAYDFSMYPSPDRNIFSHIISVDGKSTGDVLRKGAIWVRTTPGDHLFHVVYVGDFIGTGQYFATYKRTITPIPIEIKDMKPRHVYIIRYTQIDDKNVSAYVSDLGENPNFSSVQLGLSRKTYPVKFD